MKIYIDFMVSEGLFGFCVNLEELVKSMVNYSGVELKGFVIAVTSYSLTRYIKKSVEFD